ncbi:hypothetical protein U9M48_013757 [Paspalum notatum var. saurae]|uniref:Uncharacterized protein n=1 Tax=Paspalum notatum var. saurae TaxID=547442 RepID=A0AAQ3WJV6_PASNO
MRWAMSRRRRHPPRRCGQRSTAVTRWQSRFGDVPITSARFDSDGKGRPRQAPSLHSDPVVHDGSSGAPPPFSSQIRRWRSIACDGGYGALLKCDGDSSSPILQCCALTSAHIRRRDAAAAGAAGPWRSYAATRAAAPYRQRHERLQAQPAPAAAGPVSRPWRLDTAEAAAAAAQPPPA